MPFLSRLLSGKRKPKRRPPFKELYGLNQRQSISDFERKMIYGMHTEKKEVCVTAFCRGSEVLNVTAAMGTRNRCTLADDYSGWGPKAKRIGATEIRQYHNHLGGGESTFSPEDRQNYYLLREMMQPYDTSIRFFLVYQRWLIGGYAIKEFRG